MYTRRSTPHNTGFRIVPPLLKVPVHTYMTLTSLLPCNYDLCCFTWKTALIQGAAAPMHAISTPFNRSIADANHRLHRLRGDRQLTMRIPHIHLPGTIMLASHDLLLSLSRWIVMNSWLANARHGYIE